MEQETRLKRAHIALMKHKDTALYSGVVLMGTSKVVDNCPTAYTDGVNKRYGRKFMEGLSDPELTALVLHENLHVALNHMGRFKQKFEENPQLMNVAADYVVNDIIVSISANDSKFIQLSIIIGQSTRSTRISKNNRRNSRNKCRKVTTAVPVKLVTMTVPDKLMWTT